MALVALTVSKRYAVPVLVGKGMTDEEARDTLEKARILGRWPASKGTEVFPVTYSRGLFTIENPT